MSLSEGTKLGPYEITELIGKGGMGEVFKAHDTRLDRTVAIKQSSSQFSDRFEREARAIAALNHPHICALYDVGAAPDGSGYLVMEYVEGRVPRGPLPLAEALRYARQILDALEAAHSKGIVHRDLKPENILIGRNGVKILDFGIAKLQQSSAQSDDPGGTPPPQPKSLTNTGAMIGTLQYMSPEQIEGQPVDARSDIFAFGLVLYELITGDWPFKGASQASLIASILKDTPRPIHELKPVIPLALDRIISACLEKDPTRRWQSALDVEKALDLIDATGEVQATGSMRKLSRWIWPAIAALFVTAAIAIGLRSQSQPDEYPVTRFHVDIPEGQIFRTGDYVRISPDGRKLAFTAFDPEENTASIWLHEFEAGITRRLPGTEGAAGPYWSPNSDWMAFPQDGQLKRIFLDGSVPETVANPEGSIGSGFVTPDGLIVFGGRPLGPIRAVPASGGIVRNLTTLDTSAGEGGHNLPSLLPDGQRYVYTKGSSAGQGLFVRSLNTPPEQQGDRFVMTSRFAALVVPSDSSSGAHVFYLQEGQLMAAEFDVDAAEPVGAPVRLVDGVGAGGTHGHFSISHNGILAYRAGPGVVQQLTWVDRSGNLLETVGEPTSLGTFRLSPDGSSAVLVRGNTPNARDIAIMDLARGISRSLTLGNGATPAAVDRPTWSPDGEQIAYFSDAIIAEPASGFGGPERLSEEVGLPLDWSHDGRFVLFVRGINLFAIDLENGGRSQLLIEGAASGYRGAVFSPDDRWLAYVANEAEGPQVILRRVEVTDAGIALGRAWQVTSNGGTMVRWSRGGSELIVRNFNGPLVSHEVDLTQDEPVWGGVTELFQPLAGDNAWDVTADGQRVLLGAPLDVNEDGPIHVIMNWPALIQ